MKQAIILLCAMLVFACNDEVTCGNDLRCDGDKANCGDILLNNCGVDDPMDLPWFKAKTEAIKASSLSQYQYLVQAEYRGNRVYSEANCCPFCLTAVVYYGCDGKILGYLGVREEDIHAEEITNPEVVWKPDNNVCLFN
jgi:hypothetical protein